MSESYCPHCRADWDEESDLYKCGSYKRSDRLLRSSHCYETEIARLKTGTIATLVVEPYRERTTKHRWGWVIEVDGKRVAVSMRDFATKKAALALGMKLQSLTLNVEVRK